MTRSKIYDKLNPKQIKQTIMPSIENNQTIIISPNTEQKIQRKISIYPESIAPSTHIIAEKINDNQNAKAKIDEIKHQILNPKVNNIALPFCSNTSFSYNTKLLNEEFKKEITNISPQLVKAFKNMESFNCYEQ